MPNHRRGAAELTDSAGGTHYSATIDRAISTLS
jgi:hypothetical protein